MLFENVKKSLVFLLVLHLSCSSVAAGEGKRPVVIAHRGASGYLPEHTTAAKVAAFMMQAEFIEQDVVLTRDNVPIVLHDIYLDTTTDVAKKFPGRDRITKRHGSRFFAIDFDLSEIKQLEATERFKEVEVEDLSLWKQKQKQVFSKRFPVFKSTFKLNTLEEEIQLLQGMTKSFASSSSDYYIPGLYVELKETDFHKENGKPLFSEIVLDILAKYGYSNRKDKCVVQCFEAHELKRIRHELKSNLTLVSLHADHLKYPQYPHFKYWNSKEGLDDLATFVDGLGPDLEQLITWNGKQKSSVRASEFHRVAREHDLFLHPYTIRLDDLPPFVKDLKELHSVTFRLLQVDGAFSDFPDLTRDYIGEHESELERLANSGSRSTYLVRQASFYWILISTVTVLLINII